MLPYVRHIPRRLAAWLTSGEGHRNQPRVASQTVEQMRGGHSDRSPDRLILATALENRLLLSASPQSLVAPPTLEGSLLSIEQASVIQAAEDASWGKVADPQEVVFIDARVADQDLLLNDLKLNRQAEIAVHLLDANRDGVSQISQLLHSYENLSAVHLVSHGENGRILIGDSQLSLDELSAYASQIAGWNDALNAGADLLIYGCDLAAGAEGRALVEALSTLCDCDVASSVDKTGQGSYGGDWELEFAVGHVQTASAFSEAVQQEWAGLLAVVTVDTTADVVDGDTSSVVALLADKGADGSVSLREALQAANNSPNTGTPDQIHFDLPNDDLGHFYYRDDGIAGSLSLVANTSLDDAAITDFDPDYPFAAHSWFSINLNPASAELSITDAVVIDGYTQSGATPNSLDVGNNASLRIELTSFGPDGNRGLYLASGGGGSTIRGLAINDFDFAGILVDPGADGVTIQGNFLGTDISGTQDRGNGDAGVHLRSGANLVGGVNRADRNVISGNNSRGVVTFTFGPIESDNVVQNNYIGVDVTGGRALANNSAGIQVWNQDGLQIRDNLIAGNTSHGIWFRAGSSQRNTVVQGNIIGLGADGATIIGNGAEGIRIEGIATDTIIGGSAVGQRNVISGNTGDGIEIANGALRTTVVGNLIGVDATGALGRGNGEGGIYISNGSDTIIGGIAAGEGNIIAHSMLFDGVQVQNGTGNRIRGNAIFANARRGIELGNGGLVTANDAGDGDGGPNLSQNFPVVSAALTDGTDLTINATLNSLANTTFALDFYASATADGSGHGEADRYLGSANVTTDPLGNASFSVVFFGVGVPAGQFITATATDPGGNTSEFSANIVSNTLPAITSNGGNATASIFVAENTSVVTTVTATDPEAPPQILTYSIAGGLDAGRFNINSVTGVLSFSTPPDYETPADVNADNVYEVTVRVSDGVGGTDTQQISVTVTNVTGPLLVDTTMDVVDGDTTSVEDLVERKGADGFISLREAILAANNTPGADMFTLPSGTYLLTAGELRISDDLVINGAGARTTAVDANGIDRVFRAEGGSVSTLSGLTIRGGNRSSGGGVFVDNATTLNLVDTTLTNNISNNGGAIHVHGTLNLDRVTLYGNTATGDGGALDFHGADGGSLINVTISGNTAGGDGGALATDIVIFVNNSTIADNTGSSVGGILLSAGGDVVLANSILDNNGSNANAALTSADFNIDSDGTALLVGVHDRVANPLLGALTDNGGPTDTHALLPGSLAIDPAGLTGAPAVDQRGLARDATPDIGAFELRPVGPVSDIDAAAAAVDENSVSGTLIGITASAADPDPGDIVTYSLDDSAGGRFAIDSTTGVVTVADGTLLDRELAAAHTITIRATSTDGSASTRSFTISLGDVDEFDVGLVMDSDPSSDLVNENAANGTPVGITASASDADATNSSVTYSLDDSAGGRFAINSTTGVVTVADGTLLDRELAAAHTITIRATSTDGSASTRSFTISLGDVDEFDVGLVMDSDTSSDLVNENAANGTPVGITASASDADATNSSVTYSLDDSAGGRFAINSTTGVVTVADGTLLDRELAAAHTITVRATSSDGSSATRSFTIALNAVNDNNPVITSPSTATIVENQTLVQALTATDADLPAQSIAFSITGGADAGAFSINAANQLVFNSPPDFDAPVDANADNVYEVMIVASDGAGGTTAQNLLVTVLNSNESPVINPAVFSIAENSLNGALLGTVIATDPDVGQTLTYSIVGGSGATAFAIDAATGSITVADATQLDFESNSSFSLMVQVQDDGIPTLSHAATLTVNLTDVNERPVLLGNMVVIDEHLAGGTVVGSLSASDPDAGDVLSFSITGGNTGGGFAIDGTTGVVSVSNSAVLDFETVTSFGLVIQVQDTGGQTDTAVLMVNLNPVNDHVPVFTTASTASVLENTTVVLALAATDGDLPTQSILFTISGGSDAARFTVVAGNELRFVTAPDFESPGDADNNNLYQVQVSAADGNGGVTLQDLTVAVLPQNDNTPVFSSTDTPAVSENQSLAVTLAAADADQPASTISYSIVGGLDAASFVLNASNQVIFLNPPDFELPQDADGDNVYELLVEANDNQGLTTTRLVRVTVINANDAPTSVDYSHSVTVGEPFTVAAPGLLAGAGDADGDVLVAVLLAGPLNGSVTLNPDGSFIYVPDTNFSGGDSFTYQVLDNMGGSSVGTVTINVGTVIPFPPGGGPGTGVTQTTSIDSDEDSQPDTLVAGIDVATVTSSVTSLKSTVRRTSATNGSAAVATSILVTSSDPAGEAKSLPVFVAVQRSEKSPDSKANEPAYPTVTVEDVIYVTQPGLLWNDLDQMQEQFESAAEVPFLTLGGTASVAASLSVGYVVWLIRGGSILAGMMAQLPAWRFIDPLPILAQFDDETDDEDEESLATLVEAADDEKSHSSHFHTSPRVQRHAQPTIGVTL